MKTNDKNMLMLRMLEFRIYFFILCFMLKSYISYHILPIHHCTMFFLLRMIHSFRHILVPLPRLHPRPDDSLKFKISRSLKTKWTKKRFASGAGNMYINHPNDNSQLEGEEPHDTCYMIQYAHISLFKIVIYVKK